MGKFVEKGQKLWDWRYSEDEAKLYHLKGAVMDVYTPSSVLGHTRSAIRWTRAIWDQPKNDVGTYCTIRTVRQGVVTIISLMEGPPTQENPTNFWTILDVGESLMGRRG
jgi:hypothetical protein